MGSKQNISDWKTHLHLQKSANRFVTVITVNKDNLHGLKKTIKSIAEQSYKQIQHVIVDGASKDGSIQYIELLAKNNNCVHVRDNGSGIYQAMNLGIKASTSDYVMFLNSGDRFIDQTSLNKLAANIGECDVAYGKVATEDNNGNQEIIPACENIYFKNRYQHNLPSIATSLVAREKILEVGCFNTKFRIASDVELIYKIVLSNGSFKYVPEPVVLFDMNGISSKQPVIAAKERLRILMSIKPLYLLSYAKLIVNLIIKKAWFATAKRVGVNARNKN